MFSLAYLRPTLALAAMLLGPACSVVNTDHCGNQEGNATCLQRDPATPYCSICVADNNGCLAADPGGSCLAETAPATSVDPGTSTSNQTTVDPVTSSTTGEPPTSTTPSTGPVDPSTTTDPTTGTSTTTTDATTTSGTSTSTGPDTDPSTSTGDTDTSTGSSGSESSGSSESSGTGGPVCGNNKIEGDEVCDGTDLDGESCKSVVPDKWGGGKLGCNECSSFNDTDCCIGLGQKCKPLVPAEACCGGLTCKADMLLVNRCQN